MAAIPDSELYTDAHRAKGKVVLITGLVKFARCFRLLL
jgi:hypothetical protein